MSILLSKGNEVSITKSACRLSDIVVGFGYKATDPSNGKDLNCSMSAILLKKNIYDGSEDLISYRQHSHYSGAVRYLDKSRSNLFTDDTEDLVISLSRLPMLYDKIIIVVNFYNNISQEKHLGLIKDAYVKISVLGENNRICQFNFDKDYDKNLGLVVGEIYRNKSEWLFRIIDETTEQDSIIDIANNYTSYSHSHEFHFNNTGGDLDFEL
jgi:stress response protein SCP2